MIEVHYGESGYSGKMEPEHADLDDFVDRSLTRHDDNQLSEARDNAYSSRAAIGKIVLLLTEKGIMSLDDVLKITGTGRSWGRGRQEGHELKTVE